MEKTGVVHTLFFGFVDNFQLFYTSYSEFIGFQANFSEKRPEIVDNFKKILKKSFRKSVNFLWITVCSEEKTREFYLFFHKNISFLHKFIF